MKTIAKQCLLSLVTLAVMLGGVPWARQRSFESHQRWTTALVETEACRQLSSDIAQLRPGDAEVGLPPVTDDLVYQSIVRAAAGSGIAEQNVLRHGSAQQALSSPTTGLKEKTVELGLQGLTLEQLTRFLHHLSSGRPPLQADSLTLHEPKGFGPSCLWNVESLVLSYRQRGHVTDPAPLSH